MYIDLTECEIDVLIANTLRTGNLSDLKTVQRLRAYLYELEGLLVEREQIATPTTGLTENEKLY